MSKQLPQSPFVHPSMAKQDSQKQQQPAKKGQSRIAPGAQGGNVVHSGLPAGLLANGNKKTEQKEEVKKTPVSVTPAAAPQVQAPKQEPKLQKVVVQEPDDKLSFKTAEKEIIPFLSEAPVDEKEKRKNDVISKLLMFKEVTTYDFLMSGMKFTFKLLSPGESVKTTKLFEELPEDKKTLYYGRVLMTAAGLVDVDGVKLEDLSQEEGLSPVLKRMNELLKWNSVVLDAVMSARETGLDDIRKEYAPDFLKSGK